MGAKSGLCRGGDSASIMRMWTKHTGLTAALALLPWLSAGEARAANGAYAVDAADISEVGSCKFESWLSAATNTDFSAVANPSCLVDPFKPVELSLLTNPAKSDGEGSTSIQPKAKMNFIPTGIGKLGVSFYAGGSFDVTTGEHLTAFAVIPATYRLSETMRVNLNGGGVGGGRRAPPSLLFWIGFGVKVP